MLPPEHSGAILQEMRYPIFYYGAYPLSVCERIEENMNCEK